VVELADVGLTARGGPQAPELLATDAAARARLAPAAEPPALQLEPRVQVVRAQVEARFTISQPDQL
jgi:uncharacterized protein